jgi:purine-nucleoside phosphorylase
MSEAATLELAADFLRHRVGDFKPRAAVVLGSGLARVAESVSSGDVIAFREVPGLPDTSVAGHGGSLVVGSLEGVPVVIQTGRFHLYEGSDAALVALPVRLFAELGAEVLVITNAAGGLSPMLRPPTLMLISDHINYMWRNPLIGPVLEGEERWPHLYSQYDSDLRAFTGKLALEQGIRVQGGVYAGVLGPSYETPAEIHMLRRLGADAVGMSTVPEVIVARARGLRVLGISSITNVGAGMKAGTLSHSEVLAASASLAGDLEVLIRGAVGQLAD